MLGKIETNDLKTLKELKEEKNPFERIDYKVKTIITIFGEYIKDKYHFNKFNLDITYKEIGDESDWSYTVLIKYLDNVVYDSENEIYDSKHSDRWETLLDVLFNISSATLQERENVRTKKRMT